MFEDDVKRGGRFKMSQESYYMLNRLCLIGSVWGVPKLFDSASGFAVVFPLAIFAHQNTCEEPPHMIADWYRVVAEDDLGRCCDDKLQSGYLVYVEGRVQTASVVSEQNGQPTTIENRCHVIADSVMILSKTV